MYKQILKDYFTDKYCHFCNSGRLLKEGIILINLNTNETVFISKHCLDKEENRSQIQNINETIPNLTKGLAVQQQNTQNVKHSTNTNNTQNLAVNNHYEIEYLILRQEKLSDFEGVSYQGINDIYLKFKDKYTISEVESSRLKKLISKTKIDFPQFSHSSLQKLYASSFWLDYAIKKTTKIKQQIFLESISDYYKKNRVITQKQSDAVQQIFEELNTTFKINKDHIPKVAFHMK